MSLSFFNGFQDVKHVLKRFAGLLLKDWRVLCVTILVIFVVTVANVLMIWYMGKPVNLLHQGDFDQLYWVLAIFLAIVTVNQSMQFAMLSLMNWLALRFLGRVRVGLFKHITYLSFPVVNQFQKGDLLARLSNDVDRLVESVVELPIFLISHTFVLIFYVYMIFWIDMQLAVAASIFILVFYAHQSFFAPRQGRAAQQFFTKNGQLLAYEERMLANLKGVSSFNVEDQVTKQHASIFEGARKWLFKMRVLDVSYTTSFSLLTFVCGVTIVLLGVNSIKEGALDVGRLVSFLLYLGYLSVPVRGLAQTPVKWQANMEAARRIMHVLDTQPQVPIKDKDIKLDIQKGEVQFNNASFAYDEHSIVLKDVTINIGAGKTVALVGPSGCGKSSFAGLLMRFYDLQEGEICIDGINIQTVSLSSLRQQIATVWQQGFQINGSIRDNLLLANAEAQQGDLERVCQDAFAWEFIQQLPQGLDTQIGEQGVQLSVGQTQRLSIAQALLRNPAILILDEASSALDSQSEEVIITALDKVRRNRTTLIIAHRYSSLRLAESVLYFVGDGKIISGTHDELMQQLPEYRNAVEWQMGKASEIN